MRLTVLFPIVNCFCPVDPSLARFIALRGHFGLTFTRSKRRWNREHLPGPTYLPFERPIQATNARRRRRMTTPTRRNVVKGTASLSPPSWTTVCPRQTAADSLMCCTFPANDSHGVHYVVELP